MATKRKTTAREWAARVKGWKRSGLSAPEFGRREGFDGRQLGWWKWHLSQRGAPAAVATRRRSPTKPKRIKANAETLQFVEVKLPRAAPVPPMSGVEIVLGNGRVVRVPSGCDGVWLAQVLAAADRERAC